MTTLTDVTGLLASLTAVERETEWLEWKVNDAAPEEIGEYISALSNSALLHGQPRAYLVWGVEDGTRAIAGTEFRPRQRKVGNEDLEHWLSRCLTPRIDFRFHEFDEDGKPVVILEIPACWNFPVRFRGREYIRVGSYKKPLAEFPEKERSLWRLLAHEPFERGIALADVAGSRVLSLLDSSTYFQLTGQPAPDDEAGILDRLERERLIGRSGAGHWDISNLGALVLANELSDFDSLARRAVRVILYAGTGRVAAKSEQVGAKGYAAGFRGLITYVNDRLPSNEHLGEALRRDVPLYPAIAVRELIANAMIHQDFSIGGTSPVVEIFADRIEITNPGMPLINPLRFIDEPPRSRNEALASFMRRLGMCEERGSGIDKVITAIEAAQLPAPDFVVTDSHTRAVLFAPQPLTKMDRADRVRACYQHACLRYISNEMMTNASLRRRLSIADKNYPMASRIIGETIEANLVRPYDPESASKKLARYVPFWA